MAEKHYNITQEDDAIKLSFIIDDKEINKIDFEIKMEKKENKNEYIKLLKKIIFQSRKEELIEKKSKTEIKSKKESKIYKCSEIITNNKKDDWKKETTKTKFLFNFNCDKCPFIPAIKLDNKKINYIIEANCQNGHISNKIQLLM